MSASDSAAATSLCLDVGAGRFACVDVRGQVRNPSVALTALGGLEAVERALSGRPHPEAAARALAAASDAPLAEAPAPLQLCLRPDDPNAISLRGRIQRCSGFVLEVRRRRGQAPKLSVLGTLDRRGHFPYMADFQFVADSSPTALQLVPPQLSGVREMRDYRFQQGNSEAMRKRKQSRARDHVERWSRFPQTPFTVEQVPSGPPEGSFAASDEAQQHPVTLALKALFERRPIYSKLALMLDSAELDRRSMLRYVHAVAYRFSAGPFRTLWLRYGYDPRKQPRSMLYQIVDVRFSEADAEQLNMAGLRRQRNRVQAEMNSGLGKAQREFNGPLPSAPDVKMFVTQSDVDFSAPPVRRTSLYQICDLTGAEFDALRENVSPSRKFNKATGWWNAEDFDELREIIRRRVEVWVRRSASRQTGGIGLGLKEISDIPLTPSAIESAKLAADTAAEEEKMFSDDGSLDEFEIFDDEEDDDDDDDIAYS